MKKIFKLLRGNNKGASAVEYAVMVALIAAAIVGAVTLLGQRTDTTFRFVADRLVTSTTP